MEKTPRILPDLSKTTNGGEPPPALSAPKSIGKNVAGDKVKYPHGDGFEIDKVERFGWKILDQPGTFMMVAKKDIHIDHDYQRTSIVWKRVNEIAKAWSWAACGTITIALRENGLFYAIDGQHRKLGADKRSDISELPCMVFDSSSQAQEAMDFIRLNSNRAVVTAVGKHKAYITGHDATAIEIEKIFNHIGIRASENGILGPNEIGCVSRIRQAYCIDPTSTEIALRLGVALGREEGVSLKDRVFGALYHLHRNGIDIRDRKFRSRLMQIGYKAITKSIIAAGELYGKTGGETWALGILRIVNKGMRTKFSMKGVPDLDTSG